ncbi:MAG: class I SAM-dependent methyltransferase [Acidobacteria bacterium]|nr:class I SAM-dependent methyltransferase [Acidobacteriota bacterium]
MKGHPLFAACYDTLNRAAENRVLGRLRAGLLAPLHGRVLEIGLGTGANLAYYPPEVEVIAIEPDPFMLRRAKGKLPASNCPLVHLQRAGAEDLPFAGASFDHVVSTLVLCTVADPARALSEIGRVLRREGRLHFIEHVRAEGWLGRLQDFVRPAWKRLAGGCIINRRTRELIESAGFQIETLEREQAGPVPIVSGTARRA